MLTGRLYILYGQLPCTLEILSLEYTNGPATTCRLYVQDRSLIYVTPYYKAKRLTNREFNAIQFLPIQLRHSMFKYLVYIRPFLDILQQERTLSQPIWLNPLLFRARTTLDKPWLSARLTTILKKATGKVQGQLTNSQFFCQLLIGISEKHVKEVHKPFNRYDNKSLEVDLNVVFTWQSGHCPLQRRTTYRLDRAYLTQLQPALLCTYKQASTRWHEFLYQPSKVMPPAIASAVSGRARSLSPPLLPELADTNTRAVKWKALPQSHDVPEDTRPTKRMAVPEHQDLSGAGNVPLNLSQALFPGTSEYALTVTKPPAYPADITVFSGYNETGYSESLVIPKFSRKNLHFPIQISYYNEISLYNVYRKDFHQIRYKKWLHQ